MRYTKRFMAVLLALALAFSGLQMAVFALDDIYEPVVDEVCDYVPYDDWCEELDADAEEEFLGDSEFWLADGEFSEEAFEWEQDIDAEMLVVPLSTATAANFEEIRTAVNNAGTRPTAITLTAATIGTGTALPITIAANQNITILNGTGGRATIIRNGDSVTNGTNSRIFIVSGALTLGQAGGGAQSNITLDNYDRTVGRIISDATQRGGVTLRNNANAHFIIHDGVIIQNAVHGNNGGGVRIESGTFTMHGGIIQNNYADGNHGGAGDGGGVHASGANSRFVMHGGTIRNNTIAPLSSTHGGGVAIWNATFVMHGGLIENNILEGQSRGGGVALRGGTFNMNGGTINLNRATVNGGGVWIDANGFFNMRGGTISNNEVTNPNANGGGVFTARANLTNINIGNVGGIDTSSQINFFGNRSAAYGGSPLLIDVGVANARTQFPNIRWNNWLLAHDTATTSVPDSPLHLINNWDINTSIGGETPFSVVRILTVNNGGVETQMFGTEGTAMTISAGFRQGSRFGGWDVSPMVTWTQGDASSRVAGFAMPDHNVNATVIWLPNTPPAISGDPPATLVEGSGACVDTVFALVGASPENTVWLAPVGLPGWLAFDASSGLLSGMPPALSAGDYAFTLRAQNTAAEGGGADGSGAWVGDASLDVAIEVVRRSHELTVGFLPEDAPDHVGQTPSGALHMRGAAVDISAGVRGDYIFINWSSDSAGVEFADPNSPDTSFVMPDNTVTVTANWEPPVRTVIFVDWDGTVLNEQIVRLGEAAVAPDDPSRVGHTFIGWDVDFSNISDDLVVTAVYDPFRFPVIFKPNGGANVPEPQEKVFGVDLRLSTLRPDRDGRIFLGWSTSSRPVVVTTVGARSAVTHNAGDIYTADEPLTLYAIWGTNTSTPVRRSCSRGIFTVAEVKVIWDSVFCPATYAASFPDLRAAFGTGTNGHESVSAIELWNHFWLNVLNGGEPGRLSGFSSVFCADYYLRTHGPDGGDILAGYARSPHTALRHFVRYGIHEGLDSHPEFNVWVYRENYEDLHIAFGNNMRSYYRHYVRYGLSQGRNAFTPNSPGVFTVIFNANGGANGPVRQDKVLGVDLRLSTLRPDRSGNIFLGWSASEMAVVRSVSAARAAVTHNAGGVYAADRPVTLYAVWGTSASVPSRNLGARGIFTAAEVRVIFDSIFCPATYAASFADLEAAFGSGTNGHESVSATDLWNHFWVHVLNGGEPGRLSGFSSVFCADFYVRVHGPGGKDGNTLAGYADTPHAALRHFARYGVNEGRVAHPEFDVWVYRDNYVDLQNAFGSNMSLYFRHFVRHGLSEGRVAVVG